MENYSELMKEHIDALQEVGNIGVGHAATALADLLKTKIDINIPKVGIIPFSEATEMIGQIEDLVIGIQLEIIGEAPGIILFLFHQESALSLTNKLISVSFGLNEVSTELDELAESAIQEIGNILTGAFVCALDQITRLNLITSPPVLAYDMLGAIVSESLVASEQVDDNIFIFETQLFQEKDEIKGHFLLLPKPGTLNKILKSLGY